MTTARSVFVDTSAWYALADAREPRHPAALEELRRLSAERTTLLLTNYVMSETYTTIRGRLGFDAGLRFLNRVRRSAMTQRLFFPEAWEEAVEELLVRYRDQNFSYVDATSFVAMRRLNLTEAFAFDGDFLVAGFRKIPALP